MSFDGSTCSNSSSSSGLEETLKTIILIRHAEKHHWPSGLVPKISKSDFIDNHSLSGKGCERAHALVGYFLHRPEMKELFASNPLKAVIAQDVDDVEKWGLSFRPKQTVEPLIQALKAEPILKDGTESIMICSKDIEFSMFPKRQLKELIFKLKDDQFLGHSIIVCWSHQQLSVIAKELGADAPDKWPKARYDLIWKIQIDSSGKVASFEQLPQLLMFGDAHV